MEKMTVQTSVNADILKTWNYYTKPEHITQWNFALDDWHCPDAENDLKIGGKLIARMEAKDGSEGFSFGGTYTDVLFGKRMEYLMDDMRHVRVEFNDNGNNNNKTDIIVTFDIENENPPEMQREGWQNILNNFKKYIESN